MIKYDVVEGDLIKLALQGKFDVVAHGCNCFCRMKSGIAPQMVRAFGCDTFPMEMQTRTIYSDDDYYEENTNNCGNINKLGTIDYKQLFLDPKKERVYAGATVPNELLKLTVVNCYTQFKIKKFSAVDFAYTTTDPVFDYEAFTLCMRKINHHFAGLRLGIPMIGTGKAEADWEDIEAIILRELKDVYVTVVVYKP